MNIYLPEYDAAETKYFSGESIAIENFVYHFTPVGDKGKLWLELLQSALEDAYCQGRVDHISEVSSNDLQEGIEDAIRSVTGFHQLIGLKERLESRLTKATSPLTRTTKG